MRKVVSMLSVALFALGVMVSQSMAQVFPVTAASTTVITNVKADIVAWGVVFIGVLLTVYAYKRVKALVR